jgi:hypothetical protein
MPAMPERPLLRLPDPNPSDSPRGRWAGDRIRFPSPQRQGDKFGPTFARLRDVLDRDRAALELRDDPTALAPERVIVFEVAGTIANFLKAVARIDGLEFMAEYETDIAASEDFAVQEKVEETLQDLVDKPVPGRFYLAMPDVQALRELLRLWDRWQRGESLGRGFAPIKNLFTQLHDVRPWGPQDRIPQGTIDFWVEHVTEHPERPVRTEVELWFRQNEARRRTAFDAVTRTVESVGGRVLHQSVIAEIAYHGMLIEVPVAHLQQVIADRNVSLALADDVMFLQPQSTMVGAPEIASETDEHDVIGSDGLLPAVAALLDGVPVQAHTLLANRIVLDDPDDLQSRALVSRRIHGTAMVSLILHGDRNEGGAPLPREIYVRPLMIVAEHDEQEHTETDRLLIDTFYNAIVRMKDGPGAIAPSVFLINVSLGDRYRPFTGMVSPLARLLDFLSVRYDVLFLVSAGNVPDPLNIPDFETWTQFQDADGADRQRAVLRALNGSKHERTILSPAESLNALTIGARHHDNVVERQNAANSADPFLGSGFPNVSSALGLGHRSMIKPELYFPGGREHVQMRQTGNGLRIGVGTPQRLYGLKAASPDPSGRGRLDCMTLSDGTSAATALATRSGHQIFDALIDRDGGSPLADMDPQFYAVVVKSLLIHSSKWTSVHELLKEICGPVDRRRHVERADNSSRFVGFGVPSINNVLECTQSRATMVGYGAIEPDGAHIYRVPLPACLERVVEPRTLALSLAWFSPVKPGHNNYRAIRMEVSPVGKPIQVLGVNRVSGQPADVSTKRGSICHEHFEGEAAIPFLEDGHLVLQIWCKEDAGLDEATTIRYGLAVTIEAGAHLPVYDQIRARLIVPVRPQAQ